jgi:hypothetical protein
LNNNIFEFVFENEVLEIISYQIELIDPKKILLNDSMKLNEMFMIDNKTRLALIHLIFHFDELVADNLRFNLKKKS